MCNVNTNLDWITHKTKQFAWKWIKSVNLFAMWVTIVEYKKKLLLLLLFRRGLKIFYHSNLVNMVFLFAFIAYSKSPICVDQIYTRLLSVVLLLCFTIARHLNGNFRKCFSHLHYDTLSIMSSETIRYERYDCVYSQNGECEAHRGQRRPVKF